MNWKRKMCVHNRKKPKNAATNPCRLTQSDSFADSLSLHFLLLPNTHTLAHTSWSTLPSKIEWIAYSAHNVHKCTLNARNCMHVWRGVVYTQHMNQQKKRNGMFWLCLLHYFVCTITIICWCNSFLIHSIPHMCGYKREYLSAIDIYAEYVHSNL